MAASRTFVIVVLLILEIVAIKSMWIQIHHNGYYAAMVDLRDNGPHLLPGSDTPLKKTYIGIEFIDYVLTVLQCFFANVVDGSAPGLSLFAFQFSGTLLAVVMIVWTESLNPTNRSRWIGMPCFWALSMQAFGYGITMPIYCIVHLLSPSNSSTSFLLPASPSTWISGFKTLPASVTLGYIIPTVLICSTQISSWTRQNMLAIWQAFPLYIATFQFILGHSRLVDHIFWTRSKFKSDSKNVDRPQGRRTLRGVYLFAGSLSAFAHIATATLVLTAVLFPSLFVPSTLEQFNPWTVFIPPSFFSPQEIEKREVFVQGVLNFLQYDDYIGSAATLIWAVYLCKTKAKICEECGWFGVSLNVVGILIGVGPGATIVYLMWQSNNKSMDMVDAASQDYKKS